MNDNRPNPVKLVCEKCGYVWFSRSILDWVSCPNCMKRFDKRKQIDGDVSDE